MNALERIRNLSEGKRKVILWLALIIIGGILLFFYGKNIQQKLESFRGEDLKKQFKIPELKIPKINIKDEGK